MTILFTLVLLVTTLPVFAGTDGAIITTNTPTTPIMPGESFSITLRIDNEVELAMMPLRILVPGDIYLTHMNRASMPSGVLFTGPQELSGNIVSPAITNRSVFFSWMRANDFKIENTDLITLTFEVADNAVPGTKTILVDYATTSGISGNVISSNPKNSAEEVLNISLPMPIEITIQSRKDFELIYITDDLINSDKLELEIAVNNPGELTQVMVIVALYDKNSVFQFGAVRRVNLDGQTIEINDIDISSIDNDNIGHTLRVFVWDNNMIPLTDYDLYSREIVELGNEITVFITFEGYNLGHGFYIEPTAIKVPRGSTAACVTSELLNQLGYEYSTRGIGEAFYLEKVNGFNRGELGILPEYLPPWAIMNDDSEEGGWLGEFMFSPTSGWMITVNHKMIDVSAGAWEIFNGDVIRWQFTVYGLGADIGVPSIEDAAPPLYDHVDKTNLIRALFNPNANLAARQAALDVIINPLSSEAEVVSALAALVN